MPEFFFFFFFARAGGQEIPESSWRLSQGVSEAIALPENAQRGS